MASLASDFSSLDAEASKAFLLELASSREWQQSVIVELNSKEADLEPLSRLLVSLVHLYDASPINEGDDVRRCLLQLVPSVVCAHLSLPRPQPHLDALVLALVHMEQRPVSSGNGIKDDVKCVRMLSQVTSRSSIFHDANNLDCSDDIRNRESATIRSFFLPDAKSQVADVDRVTAQNRSELLEHLLRAYNSSLSGQSRSSLENAVRMSLQTLQSPSWPLISPGILHEWLYTAYFCMYNVAGSVGMASQTVDWIRVRASLMASAEVLLAANSIRTLMLTSPPYHHLLHKQATSTSVADVVIKAVAAQTTQQQPGKKLITNASFRAKKISDDIIRKEDPNLSSVESNTLINHSLKVLATMPAVNEDVLEEMLEKGATPTILAKLGKEEKNEDTSTGAASHKIKEKLMLKAKLPNLHLRKRTVSTDVQSDSTSIPSSTEANVTVTQLGESKSGSNLMAVVTKRIDKKSSDHLRKTIVSSDDGTKSANGLGKNESGSNTKKKSTAQTVGDNEVIDSMEKVEALIQMKKLPAETITIHSPGSGTTLF